MCFIDGSNLCLDDIKRPAICVDGDFLLLSGNIESVEARYFRLIKGFRKFDMNISSIKIIPLYERLSIEDSLFVIKVSKNYTSSGFIKKLVELFDTNMLNEWLSSEKIKR